MEFPPALKAHTVVLACLLYMVSACQMKEELEGYEILDRVRILALKSEPASLAAGDTATLSALVYDPEDLNMSYSWSWCPIRNGANEGFTCALEEADLQAIWATLNNGKELPPYDLGNEPTAQFTNQFDGDTVMEVCSTLMKDEDADDFALFSCVMGLELSVELRMTSGDQEWVALKNLDLILDETKIQRNTNPTILPEMREVTQIIPQGKMAPLRQKVEPGEALYEGGRYEFIANIDEEQAERFNAPKLEGVKGSAGGEEKKENLYINWFVTKDAVKYRLEGTLFVDGGLDFEDLITNEVELAETVKSGEIRLILVLRDERGGVDWMDYRFDVEERK